MQVRLRKGDSVRQPDGSWLRVLSVDGHSAWLEGNIVTAHATRADNVRAEPAPSSPIESSSGPQGNGGPP